MKTLCVLGWFSAGSRCSSELWRSWAHSNPCCSRQRPSPQLCCTATRPGAGPKSQPPTQPHCPCTRPAAVPETQGKPASGAVGTWPQTCTIWSKVCGHLTFIIINTDCLGCLWHRPKPLSAPLSTEQHSRRHQWLIGQILPATF